MSNSNKASGCGKRSSSVKYAANHGYKPKSQCRRKNKRWIAKSQKIGGGK